MGFEAYREAMVRKLKKELQAMVIGRSDPVSDPVTGRRLQ